jgi:integrase
MPSTENGTVRICESQSYMIQALGALDRDRLGLFDELMALAISNELSDRARRQLKAAWDRKTVRGKRAALQRIIGVNVTAAGTPAKRPALRIVGDKAAPPRRQRNPERRPREYLTPAEVEMLIATARKRGRYGHRDGTMILIANRHGLRVGELVALWWDQVDFGQRRETSDPAGDLAYRILHPRCAPACAYARCRTGSVRESRC